MHDLNDLFFFAKVVDHSGFAAAARALGMPRSRISRRIGLLEERLGVRLIQRSTRRFTVTEIGREYHRHCVAMLVEAGAAQDVVEQVRTTPQGIVRVSCPSALLTFHVADMVARFMAASPKVQVHLEDTNRRVDVIREGFDVSLRVRFPPLEESDLVLRVFGESKQKLVASPGLLQRIRRPRLPAELSALPSLSWASLNQEQVWHLEGPNGATLNVPHRPRLVTENMMALRLAALQGTGIVQLPTMVIEPELSEGQLVDVLPEWAPQTGIIHALFPSRRGLLPSVRAFIDFLAAEYAQLKRLEQVELESRERRINRRGNLKTKGDPPDSTAG
jgi:DNA-binding transcriptional LysR family regulator